MQKKWGIMLGALLLLPTLSFANEYTDAVGRMYKEGLTIHSNVDSYKLDGNLRRDEAAKLFLKFSSLMSGSMLEHGFLPADTCKFKDADKAWGDLQTTIKSACHQGIILGKNGYFSPDQPLTKAQGIVILMRILEGKQPEPDSQEWRLDYYKHARKNRLLTEDQRNHPSAPMRRGEIALLLYKAWNLETKTENLSGNIQNPPIATGEKKSDTYSNTGAFNATKTPDQVPFCDEVNDPTVQCKQR